MKLITLAAGRGLRLKDQAEGDLPKPLINVSGRPIIAWSVRSYSNLITQGILKKSDLIFVINRSHEENYSLSKQIRELFGNSIKIFVLDEFTRGPAETALIAIKHFDDSIGSDEGIIFNDCDHYFSAADLAKSVNPDNSCDACVCLSRNPDRDGSWSYADISGKKLIAIKEKDKVLASQGAPGLVACYRFANKDLFISECQQMISENDYAGDADKPEFYISKVMDRMLTKGKSIYYFYTNFAFPLGTPAQIKRFIEEFDEIDHYPEPKTYFFDIDGVLFEHDAGHHSKTGGYSYPLVPITHNVNLVRSLWAEGSNVVLTTARPSNELDPLMENLKINGIGYSKIVTGLSGGPRIIVNDLKPSSPFSPTAIAVNVQRNAPIDQDINFNRSEKVVSRFDGGSRAQTYLMADQTGLFVRKQVSKFIDAATGSDVLKIQRDWYLSLRPYTDTIPEFYRDTEDSISYGIDFEYITGNKLSDIENTDVSLDKLLDSMSGIYDRFKIKVDNDPDYWKLLLNKSVLPVLDKFEKKMSLTDHIIVGGTKHSLLGYQFKKLINSRNWLTGVLESIDSGIHTKIHGDLTFENIIVRDDGQPFLIDPLSSFMDTRQLPRGFGLTSPLFDLAKLLQSSIGSYEKWATHGHEYLEKISDCEYNLKYMINTRNSVKIIQAYEKYNRHARTIGLFLLSTIFVRIINYVDLDKNMNKAILCYIYSLIILREINRENIL